MTISDKRGTIMGIKSILVVDDEEIVTLTICAMLRKSLADIRVDTALGADDAWGMLQATRYDLILSDLNMPGASGRDLLRKVREDQSLRATPFIMLTSQSDKQSVLQAIKSGVSDYICKSDIKTSLIDKVKRALDGVSAPAASPAKEKKPHSLAEELDRKLKSAAFSYMSMPGAARRAHDILRNEDASIEQIVEAVKLDQTLTVKLLGLANSPYYRGYVACASIEEAIQRIGLNEIAKCILAISSKAVFMPKSSLFGEIISKLWKHSLATGFCAAALAKALHLSPADDHFTLGLLHDIGKLPLLNILQELIDSNPTLDQREVLPIISRYHGDFGGKLLTMWRFPPSFVDLAINHHSIDFLKNASTAQAIVGLSNRLVRKVGLSLEPHDPQDAMVLELSNLLNLGDIDVDAILQQGDQYAAQIVATA